MRKKQYDQAFKNNAVKYRKEHTELSVQDCARNLGISKATLYSWQTAAELSEDNQVPHRGSGNYISDEAKEIARLKKKKKNRDDALRILKKAIGILGDEELK